MRQIKHVDGFYYHSTVDSVVEDCVEKINELVDVVNKLIVVVMAEPYSDERVAAKNYLRGKSDGLY